MKRLSEEELRQREKEERSRMRRQEQAYREAQRGVYTRIYQEQDALPEDYREAFREAPGGEPGEEDWTDHRARRRDQPGPDRGDDQWTPVWREPTRRKEPPWQEEPPRRTVSSAGPSGGRTSPPPKRARRTPSKRPGNRRRGRRVLLGVLLGLLALAAVALTLHTIYVRAPKLPDGSGTAAQDPGSLGANRKDGVYTFLLVGRDDGGGGNTDTIMVGCYDVPNGTLDVLSIYRDTLVDAPWEIPKINSVYNRQGIEGLQKQVKNLIGYTPDYYFVVELSAVPQLVDAMGGVDYEIPNNMDYDDPTQDLHIHFKKGMQHLNGEDAVKVLRWRKNNSGEKLSVGDVGRVSIQHSFLKAMASQMVSLGTLPRITEIAKIVDQNLTSNLDYGEMLWFGERALLMDKDAIRFHNLPGDYTGTMWSKTYRNNQSYVFVNASALRTLINQYMNPYTTDITAAMQHVVHDTTVNNLPTEEDPGSAQ